MKRNEDNIKKYRQNLMVITLCLISIALIKYTIVGGLGQPSPETLQSTPSHASPQGVVYLSTPVLMEMPIEELMEVRISP